MMKPLKRFSLPAALVTAFALSAAAQQSKAVAQWANLNGLENGSEIRVVLASGQTLHGFLQSVGPDSLTMSATPSREALRQDVKAVSVKRPGHRRRNVLIGLAIGAGGGLGAGAAVDRSSHGWFPNLGKEVCTPLGAIIGAVVGVAIPTGGWRIVYRAP